MKNIPAPFHRRRIGLTSPFGLGKSGFDEL
jgi:hypothetical protein